MKWGRNTIDSIRKFTQFNLTIFFVAMVMVFIGRTLYGKSPLNAVQILWINLITDTLASFAIAT